MEDFLELGLTQNEGKVYQTLVQFGKLSAAEASAKSSVSYSRIYDVLDSLVHKGLAEVVPEKTKRFIPTNPDSLLELIKKREKVLNEAREKVKELKKFYEIKEKNPVIMGVGKPAFYKILKEMKEPSKFEYAVKWSSEYRLEWARKSGSLRKKGGERRTLVRYDKETEKNVRKWLRIDKNLRELENDGVAMDIRDEEVLISLIKSNITLLVRDKPFVNLMKKLFLETYHNSKPIE